jgi:GTPase SAR1 family protein
MIEKNTKKFIKNLSGWLVWPGIGTQKEKMQIFINNYNSKNQDSKICVKDFFYDTPSFDGTKEEIKREAYYGICSFYEDSDLKNFCKEKEIMYLCVNQINVPRDHDSVEKERKLKERREKIAQRYNTKVLTEEEIQEWVKCYAEGHSYRSIAKVFKRNLVTVWQKVKDSK